MAIFPPVPPVPPLSLGGAISSDNNAPMGLGYGSITSMRDELMVARAMGMINASYKSNDPRTDGAWRFNLLRDRLRLDSQEIQDKLPHIATVYDSTSEKVFVTFVRNGAMVVYEDDAGMFPSDVLVTTLRLCL